MTFLNETQIDDLSIEQAIDAGEVARGVYQENLLDGVESWSGSTLRGKAAKYGARYSRSAGAMLRRIDAAVRPLGLRASTDLRLLPAGNGTLRRWQRMLVITEES